MKKQIFITGASGGIGKHLVEKLKEEGHTLCGTFNSSPPGKKFEELFLHVDVSNPEQVDDWIKTNVKPEFDLVLINCAGITYNSTAHKSDIEKWVEVINVNLIGSFYAIRSILPFMRDNKYGRIINFSSVVAQKGVPGTSSYAASKAGLWGLTRSVAVENASKNITINNINLGYMNTGMVNQLSSEIQKTIQGTIPAGKFGDLSEIFQTVKYLIESSYITGTSIDLNGGLI